MEEDRARAMAVRLRRTALHAGLTDADVDRLVHCYEWVVEPRSRAFGNPRHPDLLHPGRTALILLEDVALTDADAIAAGILYDARWPGLSPSDEQAAALAGARAAVLRTQFPGREADPLEIREALVTADPAACLAALAEQLDHARHLHLAPPGVWHAVFERTLAFQPVALRAHPQMAHRYARWTGMFERRYLTKLVQTRVESGGGDGSQEGGS